MPPPSPRQAPSNEAAAATQKVVLAGGDVTARSRPVPYGWHVVKCVHTATEVIEYADGVKVATKNWSTGPINNKSPFTIAGKPNCDQKTVTCDYYSADIDWINISHGWLSRRTSRLGERGRLSNLSCAGGTGACSRAGTA